MVLGQDGAAFPRCVLHSSFQICIVNSVVDVAVRYAVDARVAFCLDYCKFIYGGDVRDDDFLVGSPSSKYYSRFIR